jgi:hypothetical protein
MGDGACSSFGGWPRRGKMATESRRYKGEARTWLGGGAGFVDEGAEVAFGVAAAGVLADFVFFLDEAKEFFDGAAFRGGFVEFELRGQAAQEICRRHDERILSDGDGAANRTRVLRICLRNWRELFAW